MQCCLKGADPVYDSLANVAVRPEEVIHLIAYIITNNRVRQSCRVDRAIRAHSHDMNVVYDYS